MIKPGGNAYFSPQGGSILCLQEPPILISKPPDAVVEAIRQKKTEPLRAGPALVVAISGLLTYSCLPKEHKAIFSLCAIREGFFDIN